MYLMGEDDLVVKPTVYCLKLTNDEAYPVKPTI